MKNRDSVEDLTKKVAELRRVSFWLSIGVSMCMLLATYGVVAALLLVRASNE